MSLMPRLKVAQRKKEGEREKVKHDESRCREKRSRGMVYRREEREIEEEEEEESIVPFLYDLFAIFTGSSERRK